jgi:hypothetical protein
MLCRNPARGLTCCFTRELVALLGTSDEGLRFRSPAELPGLSLVVGWAPRARDIRRLGTRQKRPRRALIHAPFMNKC